jgi:integrase
MPKPRPPHLQRRVTRHGKVTWYVRVARGPLIRIKAAWGTPEFDAAYQAALAGERPAPAAGPARDTLGWLVSLYRASAWQKLAKSTRERRDPQLKQIEATAGAWPASSVDQEAIIEGRDRRDAPSQARTFVMTMRGLFGWAHEKKFIKDNPCKGVKIKMPKTDGYTPWNEDDLVRYEARWPRGTPERVMLDVYAYTGLRRGDAARVGKQHVRDGVITLVNEKTGMKVTIPILPTLSATLAVGPTGDMAFNVGRFGKPFTSRGLGKRFSKACRAAGVYGKSAHGLRKAAAERAAQNGATVSELNAIFGWTGAQMASLYTEKADRVALSKRAIDKLSRNEAPTSMLPPFDKVVAAKQKPK